MRPLKTSNNIDIDAHMWGILGVGALGGLWASQLTRWQHKVVLLAKNAHQQQQLQHGLTLEMDGHTYQHKLPVTSLVQAKLLPNTKNNHISTTKNVHIPKNSIQNLLICTKSHHTRDALIPWLPYFHPHVLIVLLQNGMGNVQMLQTLLPKSQIIGAVTTDGVWRKKPTHLVSAGHGNTQMGLLNNGMTSQTIHAQQSTTTPPPAIQRLLNNSQQTMPVNTHHLQLTWDENIITSMWHKLAVNSAINGLTAIYGVTNGKLLAQPQAKERMMQLCTETEDVMSRCHIEPIAHGLFHLCQRVLTSTAANKSSMLQDIEAKRSTEIDTINGYIVRQGANLYLPCTAHKQLINDVNTLVSTSI